MRALSAPGRDPFCVGPVKITLKARDPLGPSVRRLDTSPVVALTFPRTAWRDVGSWPELAMPGVFMLIAPGPDNHALRIHVGHARCVLESLAQHRRTRDDLQYVQVAVVVCTPDPMRHDIASYVARRLALAVARTGMAVVDQHDELDASLDQKTQRAAEDLFADALLLLGPIEPMTAMLCASIARQERHRSRSPSRSPERKADEPREHS